MKKQVNNLSVLLVITVAVSLALAGCTVGPTSLPLSHPPEVSGPKAQVVVIRKKQVCSSYPLTYLLIDDIPIASLATGQYTRFSTSPGNHTLSVRFHIIDAPLLVGSAAAAVPAGVRYGRYGTSASAEFSAGAEYKYLITGHCFKLDENERFAIQEQSDWPTDVTTDSYIFVESGPHKPEENQK